MRISDWSSDVCSSDLLPNYHGWYVAIWAAGPALLLLAAWSFVQPSLVTADILSSYSAAERPQTDIERQALLAEINGLVSGSIEAAFDPRADTGVEVYEASSARRGWMAFVDWTSDVMGKSVSGGEELAGARHTYKKTSRKLK